MHRLRHVDSMRGFAALAVIYTHVAEYGMNGNLISNAFERNVFSIFTEYMDLGKVAVTVFFAVSGLVIPFSIFRYRSKSLLLFGIGRFFRLYPAYWISIPFGLIFLFWYKQLPITPLLVLSNITMLQQFFGLQDILGIYWTLQIELVFYFICALIFSAKRLDDVGTVAGVALFFLFIAFVLSIGRYLLDRKLPVALPLALFVMFWGLCMRNYYSEKKQQWRIPLRFLSCSFVIAIPLISVLAYNRDMGFHETWYKYTITYYVALLLFYLFYRVVRVTNPVFVYLGTISYSVYLFGFIVQEALSTYFGRSIYGLSGHGVILLTAVITVLVASLVYRLVEVPSIALGRRIIASLDDTSPKIILSNEQV